MVKVLFAGQRFRRGGPVECDHCGRAITRSEFYTCKVTLYVRGGRDREVLVRRSCCKDLR